MEVDGGTALIGIRMRGSDVRHPFVDLVAWSGPLAVLVPAAFAELAVFGPTVARVRCPGTTPPATSLSATVDQWMCAGRVPAGDRGPVTLAPIDDPEAALRFVGDAYSRWGTRSPSLTGVVRPMDDAELAASSADGGAFWIEADGEPVGVLCASRAVDREWAGWCVIEEVLDPTHAGRGLATMAQRALGERLGDAVLFGTIAGTNEASLRTAHRAGRPRVGAFWWLTT